MQGNTIIDQCHHTIHHINCGIQNYMAVNIPARHSEGPKIIYNYNFISTCPDLGYKNLQLEQVQCVYYTITARTKTMRIQNTLLRFKKPCDIIFHPLVCSN